VKRILALVGAAFVAFGATAASAAWAPGSAGTGTSTGLTLGVPTSVAATATSSTSAHVSWGAPGGASVAPAQYVVRRTAPTTTIVCTVAATTTACDDTGLAASTTYSYTVESTLGNNWSSGQSGAVSTTTPGNPTFDVALTVAGTKTAGTAFGVTLTATTDGTTVDTSYSGSKTIGFSGPDDAPSGTAPSYPGSVFFSNGVGTANVTLRDAQTTNLDATDGTLSGSTTVTVVAGTATQLGYSSSSPSCASGSVAVGNGGTFTTKVSVYDAWLNPTSGTNRTITLTPNNGNGSWTPTSLTVTSSASETSGSAGFKIKNGNPPDQTATAASPGLTSATCIVGKN
jgi:hypothetical protein